MVSQVYSLGCMGLEAYPVEIEVDIQGGLPSLSVIGLGDAQVKESRDRVRAAIKNSGYEFPAQRVTVNLAPANIKKEGTHYDLAIALGVLNSFRQIKVDFSPYMILGELSLEGGIREVNGVLPMVMQARALRKKLILPRSNAKEAALVGGVEVYPVSTLSETVSLLAGVIEREPFRLEDKELIDGGVGYDVDFSEVKGQLFAKRAIEVAMSGMHNLIMIGPPGVGKTMLARRIPTILPDMAEEEVLEVTRIYSVAGLIDRNRPLVKKRPFRAPHHTSSSVSLVGGGASIRPGEITLAHNGVLFLDELPEFSRDSLEALRQPLEDGYVNISRAAKHLKFPSRFLLAAAMNPCPCGYFGSRDKSCHCSPHQIQKYRNKISGPLLDRIDIHIELQNIKTEELLNQDSPATSSAEIKKRVEKVRGIQQDRFRKDKIFFNSQMSHRHIKKYCLMDSEARSLLEMAIKELKFSVRSYDKILKVSRTIADMAESDDITAEHISEAVQYRSLDKNLWM